MWTRQSRIVRSRSAVVVTAWACACSSHSIDARAQIPVSGVPVPELQAFDNTMLGYMLSKGINAGVLGVMKDGCIVYQRGFGVGFRGWNFVPEHTPFRIASVEKPLTAAAIRRLIDDPNYDLSYGDAVFNVGQPGGGILDIAPYDGLRDARIAEIRVAHLLQHQGGWDRDTAPDPCNDWSPPFDPQFASICIADLAGFGDPPTRRQVVSFMLSQPLQFDPGTLGCRDDDGNSTFCYSNFGYMVLGLIVEQLTGLSHVEYIRREILTPEMWVAPYTEMVIGNSLEQNLHRREPGYRWVNDARNVFDPDGPRVPNCYGGWYQQGFIGHGNLVASAAPLLVFLNNYYISGYTEDLIGRPVNPAIPKSWSHTGCLEGTSTVAAQRTDQGIHVVVLFNRQDNCDSGVQLASDMANKIYGLIGTLLTWPTECVDGFWVDFNTAHNGFGGYDEPIRSIPELFNAVRPGTRVRFKPGSTSWTGTLNEKLRLDCPIGLVRLGAQ